MQFLVISLVSFVVMEPITALTHRYVMHGIGRVLHRSHHRRNTPGRNTPGPNTPGPNTGGWEANDLYPVMFASVVLFGLAIGFNVPGWTALVPIGVGITAYGAAYALVHDVYIHRRVPLFRGREVAILERLALAHQVHHARNGAPYGMLFPMGSRPSHEPVEA